MMPEVQKSTFSRFKHVVACVVVGQRREQDLEVRVVDMLEDQAGRLALRVLDDVEEVIRSAHRKGSALISIDLLHRLDLDDAALVPVGNVDA